MPKRLTIWNRASISYFLSRHLIQNAMLVVKVQNECLAFYIERLLETLARLCRAVTELGQCLSIFSWIIQIYCLLIIYI